METDDWANMPKNSQIRIDNKRLILKEAYECN